MSKTWHDSLGFGGLHWQIENSAWAISSHKNNHFSEQL
jgi:hypothetical protein